MNRKQFLKAKCQVVTPPMPRVTDEADLDYIKRLMKVQSSPIYKGRVSKPFHSFYITSVEWKGKNHWELREIKSKTMTPEARKELKQILINAFAEIVVKYKP